MLLTRSLQWLGAISALPLLTACALSACGGSDPGVGAVDDGGTDGGSSSPDGAVDGAADGPVVTEGGPNPDAGPLPDSGPDGGGKCNMLANSATAVASTCISVAPPLAGGLIVAGKYHLVAVAAIETAAVCAAGFTPANVKETLEVKAGAGELTAESVVETAAGGERRATLTMAPGAANTSPMQLGETCPEVKGPGPAPYSSTAASAGGTQTLIVRLPYAKGQAIYTFAKL